MNEPLSNVPSPDRLKIRPAKSPQRLGQYAVYLTGVVNGTVRCDFCGYCPTIEDATAKAKKLGLPLVVCE